MKKCIAVSVWVIFPLHVRTWCVQNNFIAGVRSVIKEEEVQIHVWHCAAAASGRHALAEYIVANNVAAHCTRYAVLLGVVDLQLSFLH